MELSMHLQIVQSLPHYERAAILWIPASVRELTDINTIGDNVIQRFQEITLSITNRTARLFNLVACFLSEGCYSSSPVLLHLVIEHFANHAKLSFSSSLVELLIYAVLGMVRVLSIATHDLHLTELTEKLMTSLALLWFVRELITDCTMHLLRKFVLQLVLNFRHLDVQ